MDYTDIPNEYISNYDNKFKNLEFVTTNDFRKDPLIWAYCQLGIKLRDYQAYALDEILKSKNKRVSFCWARQLGKSISLGIFCLWATWFNKFPSTVENINTSFIMSRDDDTARELLEKIKGITAKGDKWMAEEILKNKKEYTENYFSRCFSEPNNLHQLTFKNNCFIKCVPPTTQALGKSASIFIIDEFAKLKILSPLTDKKLLYEIVEPTTSQTNGFTILSSTPNGQIGEFYEIFDPEDKKKFHEYQRIWFNYKVHPEKSYRDFVERKRKIMDEKGELKLWLQEYMAQFTVTQSSFFDIENVNKGIDENLCKEYEWQKSECSLGVDYGIVNSRTVLTVTTKYKNNIILLNLFRMPSNFDENLLMDKKFENSFQNLVKRYKISHIIADDCSQGFRTNKELENKGFPVKLFNFRTDQTSGERNRGYYRFRSALKQGKIKYPKISQLISEMTTLQETQMKINTTIKAPPGALCDCVDSFMMSCLPFLETEENFDSFLVGIKPKHEKKNVLVDKEWERLSITRNNIPR